MDSLGILWLLLALSKVQKIIVVDEHIPTSLNLSMLVLPCMRVLLDSKA
jgi:hypothetical protein